MSSAGRVFELLLRPDRAGDLDVREWEIVLGIARHSQLLPRLALLIGDDATRLDPVVREQLSAALPLAAHNERSIRWEVERIRAALRDLNVPVILLKGAAYVVGGLAAGVGRLASDVDILVPRDRIREVEEALVVAGWQAVTLDAYDVRHYRQFSHELPPMQHVRRGTTLDVHHNILPPTGRVQVDASRLIEAAVPLQAPGVEPGLFVLAPEDMLIHNAAHLFQDGELSGSIRDVVDADALLREFGGRVPHFWERLPVRARQLGLERPVYHVLRYARQLLATPVPASVDANLASPPAAVRVVMDGLVARALLPVSGQQGTFGEETARLLLYIRSHWLRMPPGQLAAHLTRKALRRWQKDESE